MKNYHTLWAFCLVFFIGVIGRVDAQCPNCTVTLPPGIPADTILVDSLPSAYKGAYYEEAMSFRMPYTSDPLVAVAPPGTNVPAGLSIDYFKVLSVTGLPPGLNWTGDRPVPMLYDETAPNTRDGCITLCGTPGVAGVFTVNVNLEIQVSGFIFPSPPIPLEFIVLPDTNAGFVLDTVGGCAPFAAYINNLIPSNGNPGFSYLWTFNNATGDTSTAENPDTVIYDFGMMADTVVAIHQQVIIDTFPHMLETIVVASDPGNSCNDDILFITGAPDMYIILIGNGDTINTDPNFALVGNTQNDEYPRDTMVFPGPIVLPDGENFSLEIWDDDSALGPLDSDDPCGNGPMTFSSALGPGTHTLTSGTMTVEVTISHYIDTINYVDSVYVNYCNVPVKYLQQVDRSFMAYPNPTSDFVNVRFQLNGIEDDVELNVSDMLGRAVHSEAIPNFTGEYNGQINLNNQAEGVYILQLQVGNERLHRKIVLRK